MDKAVQVRQTRQVFHQVKDPLRGCSARMLFRRRRRGEEERIIDGYSPYSKEVQGTITDDWSIGVIFRRVMPDIYTTLSDRISRRERQNRMVVTDGMSRLFIHR
jgi:hypothetical protein